MTNLETTMNALARIGAILKEIGPYAAIEIILPGGTVLALLLWLYRRYKRREALA